ncbi:cytochrome c551 [Bacillus massiliigorillae]|uniref:cytochrome c551 n=1 Tax=Bacillus massiliigorillae TaxID=1243664 RepID=UPI00039E0C9B|nr:cytochrome c [Bacillus massiliigorillae]
MNKKLLALFLGTSLVLAACGGDKAEEKPAEKGEAGTTSTADAGEEAKLYDNKCSGCHGGNLEGGVGPALDKVGASKSKEDIEKIINEGKGAMPSGVIPADSATKVAAWLAEKK